MSVDLSEDIRLLIAAQSEAIARWQAPTVGLDTTVIDAQPRLGRWQPLYRGVYAAFTGVRPAAVLPVGRRAQSRARFRPG